MTHPHRPRRPATPRQEAALRAIWAHIAAHWVGPSPAELGAALDVSEQAAHKMIARLCRLGHLRTAPGRRRTLVLVVGDPRSSVVRGAAPRDLPLAKGTT